MDKSVRDSSTVDPPPDGFQHREMSRDERARWDDFVEEARKSGDRTQWPVIGWVRNG